MRDVERIQARIMSLTVVSIVLKTVVWVLCAWAFICVLLHVKAHGLRDFIDLIWLGPAA